MSRPRTIDGILVGKQLTCGCCGRWFKVWPEYRDQDQDLGFGICIECQELINDKNIAEIDRIVSVLEDGLNPANRARYRAMDQDLRRAFALKALEEGVITYSAVRAH